MKYEIKRLHVDICHCFLDLWNEEHKLNIELKLCDHHNKFETRHRKCVDLLNDITKLGLKISIEDIEFIFFASKAKLDYKYSVDCGSLEFYLSRDSFNSYLASELKETSSNIF